MREGSLSRWLGEANAILVRGIACDTGAESIPRFFELHCERALIVKTQIEVDVTDRLEAVAQYVARLMVTQLDDLLLGRQVEVTLKLSFKFPD